MRRKKLSWKPEDSSPDSGFSTSWSQMNQPCGNQRRGKENKGVLSEQEAHSSDKKERKEKKNVNRFSELPRGLKASLI